MWPFHGSPASANASLLIGAVAIASTSPLPGRVDRAHDRVVRARPRVPRQADVVERRRPENHAVADLGARGSNTIRLGQTAGHRR